MFRIVHGFALFALFASIATAQDRTSLASDRSACTLPRVDLEFVADVTWHGSTPCVLYSLSASSPQRCEGSEADCCLVENGPHQPNCPPEYRELNVVVDSHIHATVSFLVQGEGTRLAGTSGEQILRPFTFLTTIDTNTLDLSYTPGTSNYGSFAVDTIGIDLCLIESNSSDPVCGADPTLVTKSPINTGI